MTTIFDWGAAGLPGRTAECQALRHIVAGVRSGRSQVLVLLGEAGIGKTALLHHLRESAAECTVLGAVGVESDMELAFAGLQQLCAPVMGFRSGLPKPQRQALEVAFGLSDDGPAPNRFLVGLAVLGLLAAAAQDRAVVCVVDDVQWLDRASAQALFFVARRLQAEAVGMVFAVRAPIDGTAGLPTMTVGGLDDTDARTVLESAFPGRLDAAILDRIVAEARGNPLALLTAPRDVASDQAPTESADIEAHYRAMIEDLPSDTRMSLLVAAAEPVGDPALLWRAVAHLELQPAVMTPAHELGVIAVGTRVQFRHPLARSVAYRCATAEQRRTAHG
ncbi:MAG: AAA family ATPase, partial [Mycobacterium sp.]